MPGGTQAEGKPPNRRHRPSLRKFRLFVVSARICGLQGFLTVAIRSRPQVVVRLAAPAFDLDQDRGRRPPYPLVFKLEPSVLCNWIAAS